MLKVLFGKVGEGHVRESLGCWMDQLVAASQHRKMNPPPWVLLLVVGQ